MCFILIGPGVAELTHFIFPVLKPDVAAPSRFASSGRRRARPAYAKPSQFLGARYRTLLLSRHVHGNFAHDPRHLRYPQIYLSPRMQREASEDDEFAGDSEKHANEQG